MCVCHWVCILCVGPTFLKKNSGYDPAKFQSV